MNFKAAVCPSCGGQLQVPEERDSFKCVYCGSDIVVREAIQKSSGPDPENYLGLAEISANEGKYQEGLHYCTKSLELDYKNPDTWYFKACCNGLFIDPRGSYKINHRYKQMRSDFKNSLRFARDDLKEAYKSIIVMAINEIIVTNINAFCLDWDQNQLNFWFIESVAENIVELEFAITLKPDDKQTMVNIVELYKKIIDYNDRMLCYYLPIKDRVDPNYVRDYKGDIKKCEIEIGKLTEKMNEYISKIKNVDPSYSCPVIIRKSVEVPSGPIKKKHFWQ